MRFSPYIFVVTCLFLMSSCKNDPKTSSYDGENGTVESASAAEVTELTDSGEIEDFLEDSPEGSEIIYDPELVTKFYQGNEFEPVWSKNELRKALFRNIENIEEEGLFFEDYHGEKLQKLLASIVTNSEEENSLLEILLTDSFLRLAKDLGNGKLNPKDIYEIWGTPLNEIDAVALLNTALSEADIDRTLNSVKPDHIVYRGLKNALKEFKKTNWRNAPATKIEAGKLIKPGESDDRIFSITKRLAELGYYKGSIDSTNTKFNDSIQNALKEFQKEHDLQIDALLGNATIKNLNYTKEDRLHQLLINLERWRWYPRDLGEHYIIVNIPNYELSVVKDGDTVRSHKTMVGTQVRKTPVFSDEVRYVIYNPTWTIPPTIKKNDVIPGASRNPDYLKKKNLQVLDSDGKLVDPSSINWSSSKALSYTFRQPAGPSNPLGIVKIIYPNEYMIYLHDTPSKKLFENNARAESSGCVRVQDALGLAGYLLSDQEQYSDKKIDEILKSGKTTQIALKQKVKVHHFYWTAYQKKDTIKFINDIYDLDQKLWSLLKPAA
ncbi:L,D-transpeptidase family protein [Christiangramia sabulilitoris]|uniref:L,D-transpeptidase family protein n=1 Tax=Christiangramia sabulilitoris TaxID=2583991 RepID=A0A550HZ62_9FLAO|nr:L,D-transpeptidase family protein [Christiangramia sabulilitoris]TRO64024.1 L,D-transpeptidase family protein [Christiangramia sabulilitoris]